MFISVDVHVHGVARADHQPPYTYLYLNKEFKSKSKWWWSVCVVARAQTSNTDLLQESKPKESKFYGL